MAPRTFWKGYLKLLIFGTTPVRHSDEPSAPADPGGLGERGRRVRCELESVETGDDVERAVFPGQLLHAPLP